MKFIQQRFLFCQICLAGTVLSDFFVSEIHIWKARCMPSLHICLDFLQISEWTWQMLETCCNQLGQKIFKEKMEKAFLHLCRWLPIVWPIFFWKCNSANCLPHLKVRCWHFSFLRTSQPNSMQEYTWRHCLQKVNDFKLIYLPNMLYHSHHHLCHMIIFAWCWWWWWCWWEGIWWSSQSMTSQSREFPFPGILHFFWWYRNQNRINLVPKKVLEPVSKKFWYRKKSRNRSQKILVPKKNIGTSLKIFQNISVDLGPGLVPGFL